MIKTDTRTVSCRVAEHGWRALHAGGLSPAEFTLHTGIAPERLGQADGRINAEQHRRFVQYMQRFPLSRAMLDVDQHGWFAAYPHLANICFNAPTLRAAMARLLAFRGLIGEFDFMLMRDNGATVEIEYLSEFAIGAGGQQALANFKTLALLVRAYETEATPFRLELQGKPPAYASAIADYFGDHVRFGQARNLMTFSAAGLDLPSAQFNAVLDPHVLAQAQQALRSIQTTHLLSARVQQVMRDLLLAPGASDSGALLPRLCDALATQPWTLRRALQQEGTSFRALELQVKDNESCRLLQTGLSVSAISSQLGFSSQSAFSRFFKARHLVPPARYRGPLGGATMEAYE